jgi:GNAT superfamily N-acetyltransferase
VPTETPRPIALGPAHVQAALALSQEAGWNQTREDWTLMLAMGKAIGMSTPGGKLVASALTLPHGKVFGWISMVLVTRKWRNRGLATQLLQRAVGLLEDDGLIPVLDATPAGEHVYRRLGFVPHFPIRRWQTDAAPAPDAAAGGQPLSRPLAAGGMAVLRACDRRAFGGDRGALLDALFARSAGHARIAARGRGYLLSRDGRIARQIGPLCADDPHTATEMLDQALAGIAGPVILDACDHQGDFTAHLESLGFKPQRPFLRMARGRKAPFGEPDRVFATAGPELG